MKEKSMSLGDRMKGYEKELRTKLSEEDYHIIRLDGKNFSKFTKQFKKPFDDDFTNMMDETAKHLCSNIQGAKFAYVQSDEISIFMTVADKENSQLWFGGELQKITSVSASMATAIFNKNFIIWDIIDDQKKYIESGGKINDYPYFDAIHFSTSAHFDSRVFTVPSKIEVYNAFLWRQQDFKRNSVAMTAHANYSHKKVENLNTNELKTKLANDGIIWDDFEQKYKSGRLIVKESYLHVNEYGSTTRNRWVSKPAYWFDEGREQLLGMIPEKAVLYEI